MLFIVYIWFINVRQPFVRKKNTLISILSARFQINVKKKQEHKGAWVFESRFINAFFMWYTRALKYPYFFEGIRKKNNKKRKKTSCLRLHKFLINIYIKYLLIFWLFFFPVFFLLSYHVIYDTRIIFYTDNKYQEANKLCHNNGSSCSNSFVKWHIVEK